MSKYWRILKEIATTTISKITYAVDVILFFLVFINPALNLPKITYAIILLVGFIISTIELIDKRDKTITKLRVSDIPEITLYFKKEGQTNTLKIMNLWVKSIKDIKIKPIKFAKVHTFGFVLEGTNILRPEERRRLILTDGTSRPHGNPSFLAVFNPEYLTVETKLYFTFKDFNNKQYKAVMKFEKTGISCESVSIIP